MADEERRKAVGKRIQRARRNAGYRSQASFADAIGFSESAVALAESGSPRVGGAVIAAIEDTLGLPPDTIVNYLKTGDEALLDQVVYTRPELRKQTPSPKPTVDDKGWTDDDRRLHGELLELLRTRGTAKVTSAMIAAVAEYDLETREQFENQEPNTGSDDANHAG